MIEAVCGILILETLLFSNMTPPSQGRGNVSFLSLSIRNTVHPSAGNVTVVMFFIEEKDLQPHSGLC